MKHSLISIMVALSVAGCQNLGYSNMTAEQIRATAGTSTCTNYVGIYGKASMIAINEQDIKKGINSTGDLQITCGDSAMSIKSSTAVPTPPGAVTTTTTTVIPAGATVAPIITVAPSSRAN